MPFNGPVIPFGAMVEYHPISGKDLIETTSIWSKSLARNVSRSCVVRGRWIWKGDIMVVDIEELEHMKSTQKDSMQRKC